MLVVGLFVVVGDVVVVVCMGVVGAVDSPDPDSVVVSARGK